MGEQLLARGPSFLQVPALVLDDTTTIGIVDLRTCLQAVAQGSPEMIHQVGIDHAVYAYDYSEAGNPLVGQGMFSRGIQPHSDPQSQPQVTGLVKRNGNGFPMFGKRAPEVLEVKLKLTATSQPQQVQASQRSPNVLQSNKAPTPPDTASSEWQSFMQQNPTLGRTASVAAVPSPALRPAQPTPPAQGLQHLPPAQGAAGKQAPPPHYNSRLPDDMSQGMGVYVAGSRPAEPRSDILGNPSSRPGSVPEPMLQGHGAKDQFHSCEQTLAFPGPQATEGPVPPTEAALRQAAQPSSRPGSRAGKRATGRPRGRPRKNKKIAEAGSTSAAEEATDADDGPQRKRAKTTHVECPPAAPFGTIPDSLRVAASTSGSLRSMRPVGPAPEASMGHHLQDVPRVPTPVPERQKAPPRRKAPAKQTKEATSEPDHSQACLSRFSQPSMQTSAMPDARSPESMAMSPDQGYAPDRDSPADLGSSPPVPRTSVFIRSSPPASSPILPPLPAPRRQVDSGFMSGGMEEPEDDMPQALPLGMADQVDLPEPLMGKNRNVGKASADSAQNGTDMKQPPGTYKWQQVNPGPVELLPVNSIYCPDPRSRELARYAANGASAATLASEPSYERGPSQVMASIEDPLKPTNPSQVSAAARDRGFAPPSREMSLPAMTGAAARAEAPSKMQDSRAFKRSNTAPNPVRRPHSGTTVSSQAGPAGTQQAAHAPTVDMTDAFAEAVDFLLLQQPATREPEESAATSSEAHVRDLSTVSMVQQEPRPTSNARTGGLDASAHFLSEPFFQPPVPSCAPTLALETPSTEHDASRGSLEAEVEHALPQVPIASASTLSEQPVSRSESGSVSRSKSRPSSRGKSQSVQPLPVPASDPCGDPALALPALPMPQPQPFMSEAPECQSDALEPERWSKNISKRKMISERLEMALERGEMPPFCSNCGAIETPTWRKIWTQDHDGVPEFRDEFSDKPGGVTTITILTRDDEGRPSSHRITKKSLDSTEDRSQWTECLLCNPCGIWLSKFKTNRPEHRWHLDANRLRQPRKKRETKSNGSRSRKSRAKSDGMVNPTSEAYFTTDPIGPGDLGYSNEEELRQLEQQLEQAACAGGNDGALDARSSMQMSIEQPEDLQQQQAARTESLASPKRWGPGSTHSRGSGTADSPIAVLDDDLGTVRRLLFPSPRKDGVPKVLGEVPVNLAQQAATAQTEEFLQSTSAGKGKKSVDPVPQRATTPAPQLECDDLEQELFGTPPARPSTPPPKSAGNSTGPFKTPTRPTPSHRPITRSISRSIRSAKSPGQLLLQLQRTPSGTPRSTANQELLLSSASKRRGAARWHNANAHARSGLRLGDDDLAVLQQAVVESPFTAGLNKLLSEANDFTAGSPSRGLRHLDLVDLDLDSLPNLENDAAGHLDFGSFLSDSAAVMPSSSPPPRSRGRVNFTEGLSFGSSLEDLWADMPEFAGTADMELREVDEVNRLPD